MTEASTLNVGGVLLDQPFKIRRMGHVGFNLIRLTEGLRFYKDLLGFRIADIRENLPGGIAADRYQSMGDLNGYFLRYGSDHHALVLYNRRLRVATGRTTNPSMTVNQIAWQIGSLAEVHNATTWFHKGGERTVRFARDMPGSNWHTYLLDPDGHQNELYYGMEQIGWDGRAKPQAMHDREFGQLPPLPQMSEHAEVNAAIEKGVDLQAGHRDTERLPRTYDVQGVLLARPFKIMKIGPVSLFVNDVERAEKWYRDVLGFISTEEVVYREHRCVYLRNNTEHHSLALYPVALRSILGLREDTTLMALGLQLANYQQLLDAIAFLKAQGIELRELPPELAPGMDHTILAFDPDGHPVQLYWAMEQIGWDGRPKPARLRRKIDPGEWPIELPANSDSYAGEPFLGPWD